MELLAEENQNIDGYVTEDVLGRGFRSIVYKGRIGDMSGTAVAVKVVRIPAGYSASDVFFDSSNLHHPNIIPVKKLSTISEESVYSVRNFVEGSTLEDMLSQRGTIETREAMHYLAQLASAIDYIHGQGANHGNIKPSNVVVDARFRAMLFDLGLKNPLILKAEIDPLPVALAHYSAPEILRGEPATSASDVFTFGVLAFELLTGSRPFPGRDYTAVLENVLSAEPLTLNDVGSDLPGGIEECFAKVLTKEPQKRYSTAGEFVRDLGRIMGIYIDEFGLVGGFSSLQAASAASSTASSAAASAAAPTEMDRRVRAKTTMMPANHVELLGTTEIQSAAAVPSSFASSESYEEEASDKDKSTEEVSTSSSSPKLPTSQIFGVPVEPPPSTPTPAPPLSTGSQLKVVLFALLLGLAGAVGYKLLADESVTVSELIAPNTESTAETSPSSSLPASPIVEEPALTADNSTGSPTTAVILEAFGSSSVSTVRGALEQVVTQKDLSLLPEMVKLADRPEYTVRIDLLKAIMQPPFFDRDESFAVIAKLITDNEYLVRGFAAKALVASKRPDAAALLKQRLAEEKNAIVLKVLSQ